MSLILYLFAILIYFLYKWSTSTFDYFEKQLIPFKKPVPFFGTNSNVITKKKAMIDALNETYNEFKNEK